MSRTFYHGIRFGLLLQLAVGPVCLFVFRSGSEAGVWRGLAAVCGVALVDALYIALAGLGVTRWAQAGRTRSALQYGGAAIIAWFALDVLASVAGVPLLPSMAGANAALQGAGSFLGAVLLTSSNPLTIVFWAGVFSSKVAAEGYGRRDLWRFSLGCVAATVTFLAGIAFAGAWIGRMAPAVVVRSLNAAVGSALLYFALRLALQKTADPAERASAAPAAHQRRAR